MNYRKAFAVAILSEVWAGAILPPSFIAEAEKIKAEMEADGTWASA
jgi:hypothetical protein